MLLKDLQADNSRKLARINKTLKEQFGFTLASDIRSGKLNKLYTKIADDLYNLKLDLSDVKDKEYVQKLLVAEGLKIMIDNKRKEIETLRESHLAGPGARRYEAALNAASSDVEYACSVGDDYEEAIKDAMKAYRSSELRFPDEMFEFDLREMTASCTLDSQISQYEGSPELEETYESEDGFGNRSPTDAEYSLAKNILSREGYKMHSIGVDSAGNIHAKDDLDPSQASFVISPQGEILSRKFAEGDELMLEDAGHSILDIITPEELEELRSYVNGDVDPANFISSPVYEKMFEYYMNSGEMPYGIAKARTGDPDQWIIDQVVQDYGNEVTGVEEGSDSPRGRAEHSTWRKGIEQKSKGSVQDYFSDRADRAAQGRTPPTKRVKVGESKTERKTARYEVFYRDGDGKKQTEVVTAQYTGDSNKGHDAAIAKVVKKRGVAADDVYMVNSLKENNTTNRKENMKEGYVKQLRKLLEAEVEQAESLIAARGFSQELQDMVEKLGRLVNEDLPAVSEQMRDAYGADVATGFENTVGETLSSVMDSLKTSKQDIDNSVTSIADGQTPSTPNDMGDTDFGDEEGDLELGDMDDVDLELPDMDDEEGMDLDLDEPEGEDELLGRAKKESVNRKAQLKKKIVEMQQKLARIKAKRSK